MFPFPLRAEVCPRGVLGRSLYFTVAGLVIAGPPEVAAAESLLVEKPLVRHVGERGSTMFATLAPAYTGVTAENGFGDPRMKGELFQEFETSSIGTGVAIGDYDGDGRPDLFVVHKTESCQLYRNLGDFKFENVTARAGVGDDGPAAMNWKQGACFVDVNNDGRLDLYCCLTRAPNRLYINQGDGTFKEEAHARGLDINDACVMAAFGDYDRDGWLDVYLATNMLDIAKYPKGRRGYLLHNRGDGTFENVTVAAGISGEAQSHSAIWWDYDEDGWPDLYVANDYGAPDRLYRNNRDGTFTDTAVSVLPHTAFSSMGSDYGDVNNDGHIDLFVADMAATTHEKDQHSQADARGRAEDLPDGSALLPKYRRNALLLGTGTPHMLEAACLARVAATDWTWSPRFEDLDNDGRLDLFVTAGFPRDPGADTVKRLVTAESPAERVRIMYATPPLAENTIALRNLGDLQFESVGPQWGLDRKGISFGTAFGDFDGDGALDLVHANYHDAVTILRNDGASGHRVIIDLRGVVSNRFGIGARVRLESALGVQVRELGIARGYMSSSEPAVHFGLGGDTQIRRLVVRWPSGHEQSFENLPVDRRFTITEPAGRPGQPPQPAPPETLYTEAGPKLGLGGRQREESVNELAGQRLLPFRLNRRGPALAVGRLTDGEREDLVIGGTSSDPRRVLLAGAGPRFFPAAGSASLPAAPIDDGPVLVFDANGDGHADLLVTRGGNVLPVGAPEYQPELLLGDGRGTFLPADEGAVPALANNVGAAAVADFDRDGRLDVFLGGRVKTGEYPQTPASALLANRGGRFEEVTETVAPGLREVGLVTAALWSDVDGDGWLDLLVATEWGPVKCYHNQRGGGFEDWTQQLGFGTAGTGWWTSLAAGDFNGDGRPDYVVGNVGLNTPYRADAEHPALLYAGDFKGDGGTQLVEAYYEGEKIYPRRSRQALAAVIPSILKRFPRNEPYARATLGEILGEGKVAGAQRYAATELRSGVFLSQAEGTFRFEPLPRIAQIAPVQGMVTGDFDGDGRLDIYAVQNAYAPNATIGRFDGGLSQLLSGDGQGHFRAVPPAESGLVVRGDAKALVVLDVDDDGRPDFVTTRNNDTVLAFQHAGKGAGRFLRVSLQGPAGNPTAVGARVQLVLADGRTETLEVQAGAGYYSQSSAACFFGYREDAPPRQVTVRWPDGRTTQERISGAPAVLNLSVPPR